MPLPRVLLVNPPIYDFAAYDFWLKPYGLLRIAGRLRGAAEFTLFDFMDRWDRRMPDTDPPADPYGRGHYFHQPIAAPSVLPSLRRRFFRYGIPRAAFQQTLKEEGPFDAALIAGGMTYWYPGVREVIEDLRCLSPQTTIVLGGVYPTICPEHARSLEVDLLVQGAALDPLWKLFGIAEPPEAPALWEAYPTLETAVIKLSDGCPLRCTYCSVPRFGGGYRRRPEETVAAELSLLQSKGVKHLAFYDDALLAHDAQALRSFLAAAARLQFHPTLHSPNALHLRLLDAPLARTMVQAGFETFYLGMESTAPEWLARTGGKQRGVTDVAAAATVLREAGAGPQSLTAYLMLGHPLHEVQALETSMHAAHGAGLRIMLSEFSPVPGTPDGEACRRWVDLEEPLWHSKSVFPTLFLGAKEVARIKGLCRRLNAQPYPDHL